MCGPLALALPPAGNTTPAYVLGRIAYNLGRIVTYCALGLVFGLVGATLWLAGIQRWVSIALGVALLLGLFASRKLVALAPRHVCSWTGSSPPCPALLRRRSFASLAVLGLLNGLLPCGLVYVACAGAAATGGILAGAQYMAAFGVGTVPMMLAISLSGKLVPLSLRLQFRKAIPVCVFLLAAAAHPARHVPRHPLPQPRHVRPQCVLRPQIIRRERTLCNLNSDRSVAVKPLLGRARRRASTATVPRRAQETKEANPMESVWRSVWRSVWNPYGTIPEHRASNTGAPRGLAACPGLAAQPSGRAPQGARGGARRFDCLTRAYFNGASGSTQGRRHGVWRMTGMASGGSPL